MLVFIALSSFIYYYLLPSGRVSDTAKTVFSLLTVTAVCLPLFGFIDSDVSLFSFPSDKDGTETHAPLDYYADIAVKTVEEKVTLIVKKYTHNSFVIETDVNITDDMCIDIKQVTILFEKYPDSLPELSLAVEKELGIAPHFALKVNDDDKASIDGKTAE